MKQKQKHFNSHTQILDEIDRHKQRATSHLEEADRLEIEGKRMISLGQTEDGEYRLSKAEKKRASADRIERDVLVKLKNALSEYHTQLLPGVTSDRSVAVDK